MNVQTVNHNYAIYEVTYIPEVDMTVRATEHVLASSVEQAMAMAKQIILDIHDRFPLSKADTMMCVSVVRKIEYIVVTPEIIADIAATLID